MEAYKAIINSYVSNRQEYLSIRYAFFLYEDKWMFDTGRRFLLGKWLATSREDSRDQRDRLTDTEWLQSCTE